MTAIRTFVIGVTGGIGSGKSTVCRRFAEKFKVPVLDTDIIAREVVEPGTYGLNLVMESFGKTVLNQDGHLDRSRLREVVFSDPNARKLLEQILHPLIRASLAEQLALVRASYCLVCIPLLADRGAHFMLDHVLVVDCSEDCQIARVRLRDRIPMAQIASIMDAQIDRQSRLKLADDVIVNDSDVAALDLEIDRLHSRFERLAEQPRRVETKPDV
jgi:dephospho-CoA kinase